MSWWSRLLGGKSKDQLRTRRVDYLSEAIALERQGDFDAALTSYRLALRDHPNDPKILQNIAIAYSRTGRLEEAIRCYRRALEVAPELSGAHYGLAFLLLKRGDLLSVEFAGGGGWGDPLERDVGRVRDDVARGYVSLEAAREDYGVALDRDLDIDLDATARLRGKKTRR